MDRQSHMRKSFPKTQVPNLDYDSFYYLAEKEEVTRACHEGEHLRKCSLLSPTWGLEVFIDATNCHKMTNLSYYRPCIWLAYIRPNLLNLLSCPSHSPNISGQIFHFIQQQGAQVLMHKVLSLCVQVWTSQYLSLVQSFDLLYISRLQQHQINQLTHCLSYLETRLKVQYGLTLESELRKELLKVVSGLQVQHEQGRKRTAFQGLPPSPKRARVW